jgi:nicotinate-nucleotide adenylyltransferase
MVKTKIAIYGGCFDPPHFGHLWVAQQLLESNKFDRVIMMPNYSGLSSKKETILKAEHRLQMCKIACDEFNPKIRVSDYAISKQLDYTYQIVNSIYEEFSESWALTICIGSDWDEKGFKNYEEMVGKCKFLKIARNVRLNKKDWLPSIGFRLSSTIIRERVKAKLPITGLVTSGVDTYIWEKDLYV